MQEQQEQMIKKTETFVQSQLANDYSGHDWWHIHRVRNLAETIALQENADAFVCIMAALLHDVADEKIAGSEERGLQTVERWLKHLEADGETLSHILNIISTMSFKGGNLQGMKTLEGKIVQDADRLDAIGAIGIGRTFAYSGSKGQGMFDPDIPVRETMTKKEYRTQKSTAYNHFYEKLLKLKNGMNTDFAKQLAEERHLFMEQFLLRFKMEWDGKK